MEADIEQVSVQGVAAQRLFNNAADAQRTVLSQDTAIVFHLADGVEDATLDSIKLDFRLSPRRSYCIGSSTGGEV